jgi:hypothetical protein
VAEAYVTSVAMLLMQDIRLATIAQLRSLPYNSGLGGVVDDCADAFDSHDAPDKECHSGGWRDDGLDEKVPTECH